MAKFFFSLRNVPDDEADEVRELLQQNDIAYYETTAGNWGISTPAIWLEDDAVFDRAKALLDAYEAERARVQRAAYEQLKAQGQAQTFFDLARAQPLKVIFLLAFICVILYFSIKPFLDLAR